MRSARSTNLQPAFSASLQGKTATARQNMTKQEFKRRWELDETGDGITYDDIADCAVAWGLYGKPKVHPIDVVKHAVLIAAGVNDGP